MTRNRTRSERHDLEAEAQYGRQRIFNFEPTPRFLLTILLLAVWLGLPPNSMPQAEPSQEQWGEKFNTAGAKLALKEINRNHVNGRTVITYNLFASGLPHGTSYILWTRLVGRAAQPAAEAFLNDEGKVVSQLADPSRHVAEDPINLKVFAGKGEPKEFSLTSRDGRLRVFAQVIPFPIEVSNGPCHLSIVMTQENYLGLFISITGFQPGEDVAVETDSEGERGELKSKATNEGAYNSALFPAVKGKSSGRLRFNVTGESCKIGVELPWGEGSYKVQ